MRDVFEKVFGAIVDEGDLTGAMALDLLGEELNEMELGEGEEWTCAFAATELDNVLAVRGIDDGDIVPLDDEVEEVDPESELHPLTEDLPEDLWTVTFGGQSVGEDVDGWAVVLVFAAGDGDWVDEDVADALPFKEFVDIVTGGDYVGWERVVDEPVLAVRLQPLG